MPIQLRVVAGRDSGRLFSLPAQGVFLIGRDYGTNTRLKDPHVAMLHCQIECQADKTTLSDRGSSGGTFLNGQRLTGPADLAADDVIRVGDTRMRVEIHS
jgi:pSer/pThr/pTyr-binding forkhead associated (FHA) protein